MRRSGLPHLIRHHREPRHVVSGTVLAGPTALPKTAFSQTVDGLVSGLGKAFSWLWIVLVAVIVASVTMRYVFQHSSIVLEELQWHLAGAAWLVGLAYGVSADEHVRVDILHERFSVERRAWIEMFGIVLLFLPFVLIAFREAVPYFLHALERNERSLSPGGLEGRWAIKFFLPAGFALLALAGLARLTRCTALLFGFPRPAGND